jgi:GMP synthase-like glutamine amidotransferase
MTLRLHYLQHVPFEGLGSILPWAEVNGSTITATRFYQNPSLPGLAAFDFLVIMGGPMGVHDVRQHPWLTHEKQFIREAVAAGKAVLGICLGAQLIADALGARVYPNDQREIGWFDIHRTPASADHAIGAGLPSRIKVFHWHGDTFDLPPGALALARSAACRNQGFVLGDRVVGLQFHLETTPESLQALIENSRDDPRPGPFVQSPEAMRRENDCYGPNQELLQAILERLAAAAPGGA